MLPVLLAFLVLSPFSALAQQTTLGAAHNVTPIGGTWCSGARNVVTGTVRFFFGLLALCARPLMRIRTVFCKPRKRDLQLSQDDGHIFLIVRWFFFF
jgi:hypothetical protein